MRDRNLIDGMMIWLIKKGTAICAVLILVFVIALVNYKSRVKNGDYLHPERIELESVDVIPKETEPFLTPKEAEEESLVLNAKAAALIDADSHRMLYGKDENTKYPMASTTKIMTCLYALENGNPDDVVTISKKAASQPKTRLGVKENEKYYLKDLLYALMLESANDCAFAIAEHIGGDVSSFCKAMTVKAKNLGLMNTQFITPNGLDAEGHYTTAYEMSVLASYAIKNETFIEITNKDSYQFRECTSNRVLSVYNKNAFLHMYDGAIGIKTGFTSKASYCFVGAVKREGKTLISTVLSSGSYPNKTLKWKDTMKLMDYGVNNYNTVELLHSGILKNKIKIENGIYKNLQLKVHTSKNTLLKEGDSTSYHLYLKKNIKAPVKSNQLAGFLVIKINDKDYEKIPVTTVQNSDEWSFNWCRKNIILQYLF